jgi:hypothetical protein
MTFADDVKNAMLELIDETDGTVKVESISLHTGDPGATGADEVEGGSYSRQSVTWGAASGGVKSNSGDLTFQIPGGTTITHVGGWTSGGTWRGGGALSASQAFASSGTYKIAAGDLDVTV